MSRIARYILAVMLLVLAPATAPVLAGPQVWTTNGPSEPVLAVALNLNDENTLLASGKSGVWQTTNTGSSWSKISSTLLGESLAYSPLDSTLVYAISADHKHVMKSTDGGATWTSVFAFAAAGEILSVLPDPIVADRVFASGSGSDNLAMVQRSVDAGATWSNVLPASLNGAGGLSTPVATPLAGQQGSSLIVSGVTYYHSGGVVGTTDGGATWNLLYNDSFTPLAGASSLSAGNSMYAGLNVLEFGSLVRSDNAGAAWVDLSTQLPISSTTNGGFVQAIATDASAPASVYIAEWDTASPPRTGVFASTNRGTSWTELGHLAPRVSGPDGLAWAVANQTLHAATDSGVYEFTFGTPPPSK